MSARRRVRASRRFSNGLIGSLLFVPLVLGYNLATIFSSFDGVGQTTTTTTVLREPDSPSLPTPHFVGRKDELEEVVSRLVSGTPSSILLYGSGGIGKTGAPLFPVVRGLPFSHRSPWRIVLALKVHDDERVTNHFGSKRGFIFCETTPKIDSLWQAVAALFSIQPVQGKSIRATVLSTMQSTSFPALLLLDNFETTHSPGAETAAETFLTDLSAKTNLSILVTFQGNIAWTDVEWSLERPIDRLSLRDAVALYERIHTKTEDPKDVEELMKTADRVPLVIRLVAARKESAPRARTVDSQRFVSGRHLGRTDSKPRSLAQAVPRLPAEA